MNDKNVNSKIAFFKEKNTKVHIDCSNRFYNGFILDVEPGKEFLILIDDKLGEVPIMFEEIVNIEPFKNVKTGETNEYS